MTTLVVGATGATGQLVVEQLLANSEQVRVIVRSIDRLPEALRCHDRVSITEANLLDLSETELRQQVDGCRAVVSCLGHNLTLKGIFGQPKQLVTIAVQRLCRAIELNGPATPVRFILMNSTGNQNTYAGETVSTAQSRVVGMIRHLVPPHADNEKAAAYLQSTYDLGHKMVEWTAVRPDALIDDDSVTTYSTHPSPTCSAIFDDGKTSRINVASFMTELALNDDTWRQWKSQMPVIYNSIRPAA
ncbi:MAG: nucleoside-diphosphate-sugar epimerase [Candidatus Azotimanducaceae bacterium]|jgi:nucleoside-diphosphate-sugar epimerase